MGSTGGSQGSAGLPLPFPLLKPLFRKATRHLVGRRPVATHLEVGELSESLFAARMRALVGSVACVDSAMGSPMR